MPFRLLFFAVILCANRSSAALRAYSLDGEKFSTTLVVDDTIYTLALEHGSGHLFSVEQVSYGRALLNGDLLTLVDSKLDLIHTFKVNSDGNITGLKTFTFLNGRELAKQVISDEIDSLAYAPMLVREPRRPLDLPGEVQDALDSYNRRLDSISDMKDIALPGAYSYKLPPRKGESFWIEFIEKRYTIYFFDKILSSGIWYRDKAYTVLYDRMLGYIFKFQQRGGCLWIDRFPNEIKAFIKIGL